MYERSAVVLERYFTESFYYNLKSNLKNNYDNYRVLIEILEKYQEVSEAEDKIIKECEDIASQIKQIQKNENALYRKNLKLQEERNTLFENIDESATELGKQLDKIEKEIDKINTKMRPIDQEFTDTIEKFNEKSEIRAEFGRKRRKIEKEYRSILEKTKKNISEIETKKISEIKTYLKTGSNNVNEELKMIMTKNGEKEKVPFDSNVIENSIIFAQNMYKNEAGILIDVYDRTNRLLNEIRNNSVKIRKYKIISKNSKNKLIFLNVQKDYLAQFLDNERLSVGLGKKEHKKIMKEACNDFKKDTEQINNLYTLLLGEISGEINANDYDQLYSADYLIELKKKEEVFDRKLRKLNMIGQIINPINWRVESIEKIYSVFDEIVINEYNRDISRYKLESEEESEDYTDELTIDDSEDYTDELSIEDYELEDTQKPILKETTKKEETKKGKTKEIEEEIEYSNDVMGYYDNLDQDSKFEDNQEYNFTENDEEDDYDDYDDNDDFEGNFYKTLYNDDDFYDDEEDDYDVYEDLETILKNRKKRLSRARVKKTKTSKKKGIFGLGAKKW